MTCSKITVKKLSDEVEKLKDDLKDSMKEVDILKLKVSELADSLETIKKDKIDDTRRRDESLIVECRKCHKTFFTDDDLKQHERANHGNNQAKCQTCGKEFPKNSDLEVHIEIEHSETKKFNCNDCDMTFVLEWRLKKHRTNHTQNKENVRYCHFYNNEKSCPFAKLGCMFKHENAPKCRYMGMCSNKMCQFKHLDLPEHEQSSCDQCEYPQTSDENVSTHVTVSQNENLIDDEGFELYVDNCFSTIFENFVNGQRKLNCYYCSV